MSYIFIYESQEPSARWELGGIAGYHLRKLMVKLEQDEVVNL
jgi:hypothetical protein